MSVENCHPFLVGGDKQTVLAHNGILPIPTYDHRSDTRVFAEDIMPTYDKAGGLDNPVVFNAIERWASGSKILVLTINASFKRNVYLLNENAGHFDSDGIWWSNYNYVKQTYLPYSYTPFKQDKKKSEGKVLTTTKGYLGYDWECGVCKKLTSDADYYEDGLCSGCDSCLWCGDNINECLCYKKTVSNKADELGWYMGY